MPVHIDWASERLHEMFELGQMAQSTLTKAEYTAARMKLAFEIAKVHRDREQLLAALKSVEWNGGGYTGFCPSCGGQDSAGNGHKKDCQLAAALALARGETPKE